MAGYAFLVLVLPSSVLDDLHTHVPGIDIIGSFLGGVDPYTYYDPTQKIMKKMLLTETNARSVVEEN